ncbi:winged helix-turn-helix domain-containing protein [Kineobactrum sediminis]|nr:winged helix-turn-helix domain-containing protein [Kineobactrum sediminis]
MMSSGSEGPACHAFGQWRFDADTGDLFNGTVTLRLEPQVAKLLCYFLSHQNILISRKELMAAVWDDRIVSDDALNRCISILRRQLTPDDRNAYIETVTRRGFISHFPPPPQEIVSLETAVLLEDGAPTIQQRGRSKARLLAVLAGVGALVVFGVLQMFGDSTLPWRSMTPSRVPMIAVLPFASTGAVDDSEFFARGMHDDVLTQLAQLESIRVISGASVAGYRDSERKTREIGRELGVDAILEGSVQRVGDQIRINVQLIDVYSDVHLWARQYNRELTPKNIFGIQAGIARSVASALSSGLTQQDMTRLNVLPTENMAAYRAYHEAMELRNTETIATPAYRAALERAVALDRHFVRAWAELAGSLSFMNIAEQDPDSIRRLEDILERIRALAPQSSEYLIAQAYYTYYVLKDYDRAYGLISQARSLRPSDVHVLELQSWIQRRQGDYTGKIETIRQARNLDPKSAYWTLRLVSNLLLAHRYDEAMDALESAPVEDFRLAVLRSILRVQDHREPARLLPELVTLQQEYGAEAAPVQVWEAHIAARDYQGAMVVLDTFQAAGRSADDWGFASVPDITLARLITTWFQGEKNSNAALLLEMQGTMAKEWKPGAPSFEANADLVIAMVTAATGKREETERLVRSWLREASRDVAELVNQRHYACRALAIVEAVAAALECLRSGLMEPSRVMPFLEPFLPYYDLMRNEPRFVEFLAELDKA